MALPLYVKDLSQHLQFFTKNSAAFDSPIVRKFSGKYSRNDDQLPDDYICAMEPHHNILMHKLAFLP